MSRFTTLFLLLVASLAVSTTTAASSSSNKADTIVEPLYVQAATPNRIVSLSRRSVTFYPEEEVVDASSSSSSSTGRNRGSLEYGVLVRSAFVKANQKRKVVKSHD